MAAGYCTVCRRGYRGGYAAHAATKSHRAAAGREATRRMGHGAGAKTRRELHDEAWARSRRIDTGRTTHAMIRKHKRRRPLDGPTFSVRVRRYAQRRPRVFTEYRKVAGDWYTVTFDNATSRALRMVPSGRAVRRRLAGWSADRVLRSDLG